MAPVTFALRRLRARPLSTIALILMLGAACGLIGWSSLGAGLAQEKSVRARLRTLPPQSRSFAVRYFTLPLETDFRSGPVRAAFDGFADVTGPRTRVQIWHSIVPNHPSGLRLAVVSSPAAIRLESGRLPEGCQGRTCEAVSLEGKARAGDRVPLGKGRFAQIVGRGSLRPSALPDRSQLARQTLLVESLAPPLRPLVRQTGSTVVDSAALDPAKVHAFDLTSLSERFRRQIIRLERGDSLVRATAPVAMLDDLRSRGAVARRRLLLVAGQAAALIIAFAGYIASARRRESELAESQLLALGASRRQIRLARGAEALFPSLAAVLLALAGLVVAAVLLADSRRLPLAFVHSALPLATLLAVVAAGAFSCAMLVVSVATPRQSRFGLGALELTALVALGVLVWQTAATGALDPNRVARDGGPVILVLPALGFFVAGVLMLRLLPVGLRAGEHVAQRGPVAARLALLTAARSPRETAAATTFLAVALGSALFSVNYRATLERQARDQARFAAGAAWRLTQNAPGSAQGITPLNRFAALSRERPTPAMRIDADLVEASPEGAQLPITVLALPAARLRNLLGWRTNFSQRSPTAIADRLRPRPVALKGPRIEGDEVRVWARSQTDYPRLVILHLLLRGQGFAHLRLGVASTRWARLEAPLPRRLQGAQLVGIEESPTYTPVDFRYDPKGFVDLGRIELRRGGVWTALPSLGDWTETTSPDGRAGILVSQALKRAPIAHSLRFYLNGTFLPLIRPRTGLPDPNPGFETGPLPVLASNGIANQAVDGLLTLDLPGKQLEGRVAATARLFPTITDRKSAFVVVDYQTLFAAMNADQPGLLGPGEAWFFQRQHPRFAAALPHPPFRVEHAVSARALERRLLEDPLALGTRTMLADTAVIAAVLALVGLVLAGRSALAAERLLLAEYEALGVARSTLRRSAQLRLVALSLLGLAGGLLGAFFSSRITAAFVAVSGTATRPLPPIVAVITWPAAAAIVLCVVVAGAVSAAVVARRALHEPAARRLRA